ncbi:hypothetical protein [Aureimonas sp. AU40]|uniref:hypothetical protein n=1 Tax=Aureimonas sp. AU40 TaxID=1637747 RepID=UPI00078052BB|nr:hypothetical protein [Aureimonas sp. AU40]
MTYVSEDKGRKSAIETAVQRVATGIAGFSKTVTKLGMSVEDVDKVFAHFQRTLSIAHASARALAGASEAASFSLDALIPPPVAGPSVLPPPLSPAPPAGRPPNLTGVQRYGGQERLVGQPKTGTPDDIDFIEDDE